MGIFKIAHLYYDILNLYCNDGNIKAIEKALDNQNIASNIEKLTIGDNIDFSKYDLIYIGSGTENNLRLVLKDIKKYKNEIKEYIDNNRFFLSIGNSIDLFGQYIQIFNNKIIETLGIFSYYTQEQKERIIGEIVCEYKKINTYIIGFQNRQSLVKENKQPLFNIVKEIGSNTQNSNEGVLYKNFLGTYVLGPIMVRNPEFVEWYVKSLVKSKLPDFVFKNFDLEIEYKAYNEFIKNGTN